MRLGNSCGPPPGPATVQEATEMASFTSAGLGFRLEGYTVSGLQTSINVGTREGRRQLIPALVGKIRPEAKGWQPAAPQAPNNVCLQCCVPGQRVAVLLHAYWAYVCHATPPHQLRVTALRGATYSSWHTRGLAASLLRAPAPRDSSRGLVCKWGSTLRGQQPAPEATHPVCSLARACGWLRCHPEGTLCSCPGRGSNP